MKTFTMFSLAAALALVFASFGFSNGTSEGSSDGLSLQLQEASAWGKDCARTKFKTKMVETACKDGGQKAAKKAMKTFLKAAKKATDPDLNCKSCHTSLSSSKGFPLKTDALKLFKKLGGK